MAVTVHASTPAVVNSASGSTSATIATASFSPPAGAYLVAMYGLEYKAQWNQITTTTTWNATGASNWRLSSSPYWDGPYPKQGQYSNYGNNVGIWLFNSANMRSVLAGATITKTEVFMQRRSEGGINGPNNAYLWTQRLDAVDGGAPDFTGAAAVGTYCCWSWGTAAWVTVPNSTGQAFQSGTAHNLSLWDVDADSSDYSIWETNAAIRITYVHTGATPDISCSSNVSNSWTERYTFADTTGLQGELGCWSQQLGSAPGAMTVTVTRTVDTKAAGMSLAVYVLQGASGNQAGSALAHSTTTANTGCQATMNLQRGSIACLGSGVDARPALTRTSNITETGAFNDATSDVALRHGRLTTATTVAGNNTVGWTTTDAAARKMFLGLEILTGAQTVAVTPIQGHVDIGVPTLFIGTGAKATPDPIICTTTIVGPEILAESEISNAPIVCTTTIPAVSLIIGAAFTVAPVRAAAALPSPAVATSITIYPAAIVVAVYVPGAFTGSNAYLNADPVRAQITIPAVVTLAEVKPALVPITTTAALPAPVASASCETTATAVLGSVALPAPAIVTSVQAIPAVILGRLITPSVTVFPLIRNPTQARVADQRADAFTLLQTSSVKIRAHNGTTRIRRQLVTATVT